MRLLRCHIENFGVLSGFDYEFPEGLAVICRENGFGKSTLAAFLKAMFYGLPRTGAHNVTENERRRFEPWQGGKFGGFLEFEYQGAAYRVTRYFGKTAAKDTFSLRDLRRRTDETPFSSRLGEELFGLDAASFARSTYLPQAAEADMQATTSMRAKLSNLVDDTNDMNNFDTAEQALRQFRRNLRAYSGDKGEIADCERELHVLEAQTLEARQKLPRLEEVLRELNQANEAVEQTTAEIADLREKIRISSDQKARSMQLSQRKELAAACEKQEALLQALFARYPAGLPSAEEIRRQREHFLDAQQACRRLGELTTLATVVTAPATVLMAVSSTPKTIASPVATPASAARNFLLVIFRMNVCMFSSSLQQNEADQRARNRGNRFFHNHVPPASGPLRHLADVLFDLLDVRVHALLALCQHCNTACHLVKIILPAL